MERVGSGWLVDCLFHDDVVSGSEMVGLMVVMVVDSDAYSVLMKIFPGWNTHSTFHQLG